MVNNHNYKEPEPGQNDWHVPINENFEQLNKDVEIRDVEEKRPEYDPKEGTKFLATDTEEVFIGDGEQWVELDSRGRTPSFDSVSENIGQTHGDFLIYESEGTYYTKRTTTGEITTSESDAGVAIQYAVDSLPDEGGVVILGEMSASPDTGIDITRGNVALIGQGRNATLLDFRGGPSPANAINIDGDGSNITDVFVRGFRLKTPNVGVRADWVNTIRLTNIEVNAAHRGFVMNHHYDFIHRHLNANWCDVGFESTDDLNGGIFERCQMTSCFSVGWLVDDTGGGNPRYVHWDSCKSSDPGGQGTSNGFIGRGLEGCVFTNWHSENINGSGDVAFKLTGKSGGSSGVDKSSRANTITGGFFYDADTAMEIDDAQYTTIQGCEFRVGDVSEATGMRITSNAANTHHRQNYFKSNESRDSGRYSNEVVDSGSDTNKYEELGVLDFRPAVSNTTTDSMTADPEKTTEDAYIEVEIQGKTYQIPAYLP